MDNKVAEEVKTRYRKTEDLDLVNTYRVKNAIDPVDSGDYVTKSYCDSNKTSGDGTGVWLGSLLGGVGGAISGAITSGIFSAVGGGLASVGQVVGSLSAGAIAGTGIKLGSAADFGNYVPQ